jgi:two-component system, OmpR family, response regulator MtrA
LVRAELPLTLYEHRLLTTMATDPDRVWTHEHLHLAVWKTRFLSGASDLYSGVKRLRRKLEGSGVSVRIESVRGVGFRLVPTLTEDA